LVEQGDNSYALFFGHLAIEKVLKAVYVARNNEHAPFGHNLIRLANAAGMELTESQAESLVIVTAFNIEARYPDLKRSFRQKCTLPYTRQEMTRIKELFRWLNSLVV
jgi:HEPN domain-containing protein